uniref:Elongation factor Ts, mitochondrial n=1 Tax=Kumanoa americana TaxID=1196377 RepID=A0A1C9CGG3_9FLOR|nr:elongation factor Ts [Kumanoa americana]AOM67476.1 elongation factor Ts [Kumanoa americana]
MSIKISPQNVKELRVKTGAGMMDCKKALEESKGNIEQAIENLRKKGLASASKKAHRSTTEGLIDSYIHAGSKIGVILEINCETDFVARRIEFKELSKNIAMQIAACGSIEYVNISDIPINVIEKEKIIEQAKEDLKNKPTEIRNKIIDGRIQKRLEELSLMNQLFIKNTDITVADLVNQHIALLGENIKVKRFCKFILGENYE